MMFSSASIIVLQMKARWAVRRIPLHSAVFCFHSCCVADSNTRPDRLMLSTCTSTAQRTTMYYFLFNTVVLAYNATVVTHLCELHFSKKFFLNFQLFQ